jgi:hypothetical protein
VLCGECSYVVGPWVPYTFVVHDTIQTDNGHTTTHGALQEALLVKDTGRFRWLSGSSG